MPEMPEVFPNNPGIPAVLSFIFNGLGQIYNGQIKKGLVIMFFSSVGMFLILVGAIIIGYWLLKQMVILSILLCAIAGFIVGLILVAYLGAYSITDAYNFAKKSNDK